MCVCVCVCVCVQALEDAVVGLVQVEIPETLVDEQVGGPISLSLYLARSGAISPLGGGWGGWAVR